MAQHSCKPEVWLELVLAELKLVYFSDCLVGGDLAEQLL